MRTSILSLVVVAAVVAMPASAQTVLGLVVDDETGRPLEGVRVTLVDPDAGEKAGTFTDAEGRFVLEAPEAGEWRIGAALIGYGPLTSEPVPVAETERVEVEVRLGVEAVPLEPLIVTSRIAHANPDIRAFYARMERGGRSGIGRFVDRDEIERRSPTFATDLLQLIPGIRVVQGGYGRGRGLRMSGNCAPAVFIDGMQINRMDSMDSLDNYVSPLSIEGIEVYRGAGQQVGRYYDRRGCGLVLVWTRRGTPEGKAFSWTRLFIGAGIVLGLFVLR